MMLQFFTHLTRFFAAPPVVGQPCDLSGGGFLGFHPWYYYMKGIGAPSGDPTLPPTCVPRLDSLSDIWLIAAAVIEIMLRLAALGAVLFIVYGGIQLITAQGDPNGSKQARATITNAVIGLIISISAATIISFVAGRFS